MEDAMLESIIEGTDEEMVEGVVIASVVVSVVKPPGNPDIAKGTEGDRKMLGTKEMEEFPCEATCIGEAGI